MRPDRVHDEEELNEDAAERQNAAHYDAGDRLRVDRLLRNLARDLVRAHWVFEGLQKRESYDHVIRIARTARRDGLPAF